LAAVIAGVNGVKRPSEAVAFTNPFGLALYQQEAKALVPTAAAKTTLRLWDEGKLPGWVVEWLDRRLLEAAAA